MDGQLTWVELRRLADDFWEECGQRGDLKAGAATYCKVMIVELRSLSYFKLKQWYALNQPGRKVVLPREDRGLHGFFDHGKAQEIIFLNKDDEPPERRFSLAHELAHFLVEYDRHRKWAEESMGLEQARRFLANRTKTNERIQGHLHEVSFGPFSHFLEMGGQSGLHRYSIAVAERNADLMACELLAPRMEVQAKVAVRRYSLAQTQLLELLLNHYQIPARPAERYAEMLADDLTGGPSFEDWLEMDE